MKDMTHIRKWPKTAKLKGVDFCPHPLIVLKWASERVGENKIIKFKALGLNLTPTYRRIGHINE